MFSIANATILSITTEFPRKSDSAVGKHEFQFTTTKTAHGKGKRSTHQLLLLWFIIFIKVFDEKLILRCAHRTPKPLISVGFGIFP